MLVEVFSTSLFVCVRMCVCVCGGGVHAYVRACVCVHVREKGREIVFECKGPTVSEQVNTLPAHVITYLRVTVTKG